MGSPEVRQTVIGSGNIFTATGDVRIAYHLPPAEAEERRVLLQLTASVKQFWIAGVLERSVHEVAMIELRKEARPEAVQHPWERVLEIPGQPATALGPERGIGEVFRETGNALLLLGEPGAGKTITLLELARDLIDRFEKNPAEGVPVVLNLSTWEKKWGSLNGWVQEELKNKYAVPTARSRAWLASSRLILLLDGLDEAAPENQAACVQAINAFRETAGAAGLVVCSRLSEYLALPERLRFAGAVCLQPLTLAQVDQFFASGGEHFAAVRTAIKTDPVLQELARSPLLVNVISLAYRDASPAEMARQESETMEARRRQLFGAYARRMFQRTAYAAAEFPEARTREWLAWLAQRMRDHSLAVFALDQLQPSWLSTMRDRWLYAFLSRTCSTVIWAVLVWVGALIFLPGMRLIFARGTFFVLLGALLAGGFLGWVDGLRLVAPPQQRGKWVERFRVIGIILVCAVGLGTISGVVSRLFFEPVNPVLLLLLGTPDWLLGWRADAANGFRTGLFFGLMFGLRGIRVSPAHDIWLVESLRLSATSAWRAAKTAALPGALVGGVLVNLLVWTQPTLLADVTTVYHAIGSVIGMMLVVGLLASIVGVVGAAFGMFTPKDLPGKVRPTQWLRRSVQNAIVAGGVVMIGAALILVPIGILGWSVPLALWNSWSLGVAAALWYGGFDALQHLSLIGILRHRGRIPRGYVRFLDSAARLVFLQKVGAGYLFMHRQLREYFAEQIAPAGVEVKG